MVGAALRVLVIALVLLVGVMLATSNLRRPPPAPELATYFDTPLLLPEFSLVDTTGRTFTRDDLRGQFSLMFFGFTNCPDICPVTLAALASALTELEAAAGELPHVVFVSVDPQRDTPERIADYLQSFDPRFTGVTGEPGALEPLYTALGVTVMTQALLDQPGYTVTHNGTIYMIGPDAELIATLGGSPPPPAIASDFRRVRQLHLQRRLAHPPRS